MNDSKSKILLVITPDKQSTEALHWCLHKAKQSGGSIKIICVISKESQEEVKEIIEEIEKQCRAFNVKYEASVKFGNYLEVCETAADEKEVKIMVVTERKAPFFRRIFEGSEGGKLRKKVSCEIKVYPSKKR